VCVSSPETCPCPACDNVGNLLKSVSQDADVDYYRCQACAHVWSVPKGKCEPTNDVTVKPHS